ncbi:MULTISPECIES: winged helix-turn-helix domain-containing protein [Rhizobium]|uniref:winged helix-turn-helix domain-containing protein n=1 Tax=Rhizobium TaxID=379 RepID=UPI001409DA9F|nr:MULTISPECIES: winged helix-turn-helix domain-containing protein [Rhizobium]MDG3578367.1 winged helix-turn-helix domain-containing protein [Rhizobium sp. YJ-22]
MTATAAKFDTDKFRKVAALITGGATEGERASAKARAEAIAGRAGMTLKQAMAKIDSKPAPKSANFFEGFDDWMEKREPGHKARQAQKNADRQSRKAMRRAEILKTFGTMKAFFDATPMEEALIQAAKPFARREVHEDWCGTRRNFTVELGGCSDDIWMVENTSGEAKAAIRNAVPFPATIRGLLDEYRMWEALRRDRQAFIDGEYYPRREAELRSRLVQEELKTRPVASWDDMQARFDFKRFEWESQWLDPQERKDEEADRLEADFAILRDLYVKHCQPAEHPAQNPDDEKGLHSMEAPTAGYRTNADRKSAVLSALRDNPGLSDREIARIAGVSHQTVSNWRRRLQAVKDAAA